MKQYLHKLPIMGFALLTLAGCKDIDNKIKDTLSPDYSDPSYTQDTVKVLNVRHHSNYTPEHFWGVNRQGTVVQGHISLQPDVIFPHDGDEIVVRYQNPQNREEYMGVFDNITQRKRAAEYVKEKQR
ncbi:MAG: hypothetical protein E7006_01475 [Alphaproteobacteria bacterium]|nr:hypothetical protein [Alphaproteobacteria bacterium]